MLCLNICNVCKHYNTCYNLHYNLHYNTCYNIHYNTQLYKPYLYNIPICPMYLHKKTLHCH